jgi:hypothetical protein
VCFGTGNVDGEAAFQLFTPGGLPTTTGLQTFSPDSGGSFSIGPVGPELVSPSFGGTLDITAVTPVPEPASAALLTLGVVAVGWTLRKRRRVA